MPAEAPSSQSTQTACCVVGGGPAGMVLGFLLARAGIEALVLEKHADFFRDFRGDTIHPSTFELMYELGLLEDFLRVPHQQLFELGAAVDDFSVTIANFSHLPVHCKFVGLMPQWDFLNFIAEKAKAYPEFRLRTECEVTDLIIENGRVAGVRAKTRDGDREFRAALTVGADGRHSIVRAKAGLEVIDLGAPIDVLWMRLSRLPSDPEQTLGRFRGGKLLVTLNRGDYWQCAYVIPKGRFEAIQKKGLPAFRQDLETVAPFLRGRAAELKVWNDIKLLSVAVDRLRHWSRSGLLCIGDSAHAMSPIGGVGINLAIQDAVAASNILVPALSSGASADAHLHKVQARREFPTRMTQGFQIFAHKRFITPALATKGPLKRLPLPLALLKYFSILRRLPARMVGLGFRPEHIHIPDTHLHANASSRK
ncbi:MAG TPA: FAD-dependent oxidoreductase [Candidatus Acidoferrum sp.]|nr:FAD-dependent oxidoreductase [Candidatus Acidoferrum sp.]